MKRKSKYEHSASIHNIVSYGTDTLYLILCVAPLLV